MEGTVMLRVASIDHRAVTRGGFTFGPKPKVVTIHTRPAYLEIRACDHLRVEVIDPDAPEAAEAAGEGGTDEPTDDLTKRTIPELRELAAAANVDLPRRATKKAIIEALAAAAEPEPEPETAEAQAFSHAAAEDGPVDPDAPEADALDTADGVETDTGY